MDTTKVSTIVHSTVVATTSVPIIEENVRDLVIQIAKENGVSVELALYVAKHESGFDAYQVGDMNLVCKKTGRPVRARGVFQFTECYWPDMADSDAFNAEVNIRAAMPLLANKKTCIKQFTTCRWYYDGSS